MKSFIENSFKFPRTVLLLFSFFILAGWVAYQSIPKESAPDIKVPIIYTVVEHRGISPEDSQQLILKPLEENLRNIEGIKEVVSQAFEGGGRVTLEFHAGHDLDRALSDVRQKVSAAKADLPDDSKEPVIKEVNISLFPVLIVHLGGNIPERTLSKASQDLQDSIENHKSVLEAKLVGSREEVVDILIHPLKLEGYGLSLGQVLGAFKSNHMIVSSGQLKSLTGSFGLRIPGLVKSLDTIRNMPLKVHSKEGIIVKLGDVATVLSSYKDPTSYARSQGAPSISLEVSKRTGENIIKTIKAVREKATAFLGGLPEKVSLTFAQDESKNILNMLKDLQNNIIFAVLLVMLVVVGSLGWRSSLLVGVAIPTSFLSGILIIGFLGHTLNMVVLFSLILSVGMLVDGAIIVVEYADRKMLEGMGRLDAYRAAAVRMRWPVITSTLTVLLVFLPLLFWPGITGQFMKYLPITLLSTLTASLFVALIFIPVLGSIFGKVGKKSLPQNGSKLDNFYVEILGKVLRGPRRFLLGVLALLVGTVMAYRFLGKGVEFFPNIEPDSAVYLVRARGNLSLEEMDRIVREVEKDVLKSPYYKTVSSQTAPSRGTDVIGKIPVELIDWQKRPPAQEVFEKTLQSLKRHPGIIIELKEKKKGPAKGKTIQLRVSSSSYAKLSPEIQRLRKYLESLNGIEDITDERPLPGIFEWQITIDRAESMKLGLDVKRIGQALDLLTNGLKLGSYRPEGSRDEIDMVFRFPKQERSLDRLSLLRVKGSYGLVPLSRVLHWEAVPKVDVITRVDGKPAMDIEANVNKRFFPGHKVDEVKKWLEKNPPPPGVKTQFLGEEADKKETGAFLIKAFLIAIFLIVMVLVTQFNSFFSTLVVISAIFLSSIGVLVGLLIMDLAFSIVMSGIGVIALAGIIVSNNIIFIDTFDQLRAEGMESRAAIMETGRQRLRPIMLTQLTTILGLLPILFQIDMDFLDLSITVGAPSSAWWVQLANAIVFGVFFASILTLVVTPCALMIREDQKNRKAR